jgi:hypothetical protein
MTKPIGYWTNFTRGDGSLLSAMEETWGSTFETLNEAERAWMIYQLGFQLWEDAEEPVSDEVEIFIRKAKYQIPNIEKLGLIQALVEQIKGA